MRTPVRGAFSYVIRHGIRHIHYDSMKHKVILHWITMNMPYPLPYPVWKCLPYGSTHPPYYATSLLIIFFKFLHDTLQMYECRMWCLSNYCYITQPKCYGAIYLTDSQTYFLACSGDILLVNKYHCPYMSPDIFSGSWPKCNNIKETIWV